MLIFLSSPYFTMETDMWLKNLWDNKGKIAFAILGLMTTVLYYENIITNGSLSSEKERHDRTKRDLAEAIQATEENNRAIERMRAGYSDAMEAWSQKIIDVDRQYIRCRKDLLKLEDRKSQPISAGKTEVIIGETNASHKLIIRLRAAGF